ncbi:hypothetical protein BHU24_12830 [Bacillus pseudomycoides]|uniref:hypothetical protein n=1 Tax=Bacillus TaxID=1386 RepID=UPI0003614747|nr:MULTISPECIES: hypothetical protein [Bacillus]MBD5796682.1 hypothetical protein [Bacillus pseudomycoides]MCR8859996.1 hypothetical protein [Bacillus pseudomycoides]MED1476400.1 hypothetical protein [Bacillus pseudomycoides]PEJ20294.1 hypothetical protein CN887_27765 [Bacillus pseudomycoides]PEO90195.1 hypothetical protein CN571_11820 [Bacillus pseudomycoides]
MSKLHVEVFTGSEQAFQVTSTIIYGEKDAIEHTRKYLVTFDEVLSKNPSSEEIQTAMKERFPNVKALEIGLVLAANAFGGEK